MATPGPPFPEKSTLRAELVASLAADLAAAERAYASTKAGATHEEAKPENDKDTRALEQSYLARGQAQRVEELRLHVADVQGMSVRVFKPEERAAQGALITVEEDGVETVYFMAAHGGGARLADGTIQVVTPLSPLGKTLLGKCEGEECPLVLAGRSRELTIVGIR